MVLETKDEVVSFLKANRLMLAGKTGFKHYSKQLADVIAFIEKLAAENERLQGGSA
jgi:hypothetical protein